MTAAAAGVNLMVEQMTAIHEYLKSRHSEPIVAQLMASPINLDWFGIGWTATLANGWDLDEPIASRDTAQQAVDELVDMLEAQND